MNIDAPTALSTCLMRLTSAPPRTGLAQVDELVGHWPRALWLITAPRGAGRSALAAQIALTAALVDGRPTRLVSLCEDDAEVLTRLICARAGVPLHHLRTGQLRESDLPSIGEAVRSLANAPLSLSAPTPADTPGSVDRVLAGSSSLDMLIVDDADLWDTPPSDFLPRLRAWARHANTVVVVTATDGSVRDQNGGVSRFWSRHCDVIIALSPVTAAVTDRGDNVRIEVIGPASRVQGHVRVELEGHFGRMIVGTPT